MILTLKYVNGCYEKLFVFAKSFCVLSLGMIQRIVSSIIRVFFGFPANGWSNPNVFKPETIFTPREIFPQNYSSLGLTISEELRKKQTDKLTDNLLLCKKNNHNINEQ